MSADLHIHVFEDGELTEEDFECFFSNTMGSKWFNLQRPDCETPEDQLWCKHRERVNNTNQVHVGPVSWLKAGLLEDGQYVPKPIQKVNEVIGEHLPEIDDELIKEIAKALGEDNNSVYEFSNSDNVLKFLKKHKGKKAFTVSW